MLKRFMVLSQIFDWFLNVFAGVVSFLFDKVLFGLFLSSFVENSFHFVFLIKYYFDLFFYILVDFGIDSNTEI